ncbi:MAG TPA: hypothetical protein VM434_00315 [Beijerinckiaceae bacterium]|nr:hypothetical protein [Beijerinckiaceae bacterium]
MRRVQNAGSGAMADKERAERLKAALRENLKRRKAQARRREGERGEPAPVVEPDRENG